VQLRRLRVAQLCVRQEPQPPKTGSLRILLDRPSMRLPLLLGLVACIALLAPRAPVAAQADSTLGDAAPSFARRLKQAIPAFPPSGFQSGPCIARTTPPSYSKVFYGSWPTSGTYLQPFEDDFLDPEELDLPFHAERNGDGHMMLGAQLNISEVQDRTFGNVSPYCNQTSQNATWWLSYNGRTIPGPTIRSAPYAPAPLASLAPLTRPGCH
jgi:hypothetical protein